MNKDHVRNWINMNINKEDSCKSQKSREECVNAWKALDAKEKEPDSLDLESMRENSIHTSRQKIQVQRAKTKIDQITKTSQFLKNSFLVVMTLLSFGILIFQGSICISK